MHHELFRYLNAGICFLTPIYVVACIWAPDIAGDQHKELEDFIYLGGAAALPALAIPFGWWLYNIFRVVWITKSEGYEHTPFAELIRQNLQIVYDPIPINQTQPEYFVNFSCVDRKIGWKRFSEDVFATVFYPFSPEELQSNKRTRKIVPRFVEPVSDLLLFQEKSYDYARSISTVRYGLDSSWYALKYGLAVAVPLCLLFFAFYAKPISYFFYTTLLLMAVFFLICLCLYRFIPLLKSRRDFAEKEYNSRVTLLTIKASDLQTIDSDAYDMYFSEEVRQQLSSLKVPDRAYAALDLDDTLLVDDIGDAVFAKLLVDGKIQSQAFDWNNYQELKSSDKEDAYRKVVKAMKGLSTAVVRETTLSLLKSSETQIYHSGTCTRIPRVNRTMKAFVHALRLRGINAYIVTASNQYSAEVVAWEFFGIPPNQVFGAKCSIDSKSIIQDTEGLLPFGDNKKTVLEEHLGFPPIAAAGDSEWDLPLLNYAVPHGIRILVGDDANILTEIRRSSSLQVSFLPRNPLKRGVVK